MTRKTWKQIVLTVLVAIMIYIWWGNIELLRPGRHTRSVIVSPKLPETDESGHGTAELEVYQVKTNPFQRWNASLPEETDAARQRTVAGSRAPSQRFHLIGIIAGRNQPQAVLKINDTESAVFSLLDTLDGWVVRGIGQDRVWLSCGDLRDTLSLYENIPQAH